MQLKVTVLYKMNDENFVRTRTLTKRYDEETFDRNWTVSTAEHLATLDAVWLFGPKTKITICDVRLQVTHNL